jgi:hypothetical protein
MLPQIWRQENVRTRQKLQRAAGNYATENDRKAQLLDDQWPRFWLLIPDVSKILATIAKLHTMEGIERSETIAIGLSQLELFHAEFNEFTESAEVVELFQETVPPSVVSRHSSCCPPLPFTPYYLRYPPAAHLRMVVFCIRMYIQTVFYPILRSEAPSNRSSYEENAGYTSREMCRTYAGLEDLYWDDDKDRLLPCFSTLVTAGIYCPASIRKWLWYKLAHLETLSPYAFEPLKKRFSIFWSMPDLPAEGFGVWKSDPPEQRIGAISADVIDVVSQMADLNLNELNKS